MKTALIFDTETTGLPDWKQPSDSPQQPHLVQLAAMLVDLHTGETIQSLDCIIKPEGWEIPEETSEIHGITNEVALRVGIPEKLAVETLLAMWNGCRRVAHNRTFDQRIIRIACKRYFDEAQQAAWAEKDTFDCTMLMAKPIMKLPSADGSARIKQPKLEEAYKYFTGKDLENAHTALADTQACFEVYMALINPEGQAAAAT